MRQLLFILLISTLIVSGRGSSWRAFLNATKWIATRIVPSSKPETLVHDVDSPSQEQVLDELTDETILRPLNEKSNILVNRLGFEVTTVQTEAVTDESNDVSLSQPETTAPELDVLETLNDSIVNNTSNSLRDRFIPEIYPSTDVGTKALVSEESQKELANFTTDVFDEVNEASESSMTDAPNDEITSSEPPTTKQDVSPPETHTVNAHENVERISLEQLIYGSFTTLPSQVQLSDDGELYQVTYN